MALRLSTGLINKLADSYSLKDALAGFVIDVYSGTQPATPDTAASGTLLVTLTNNSGAYTAETAAAGTMTLTGGAAGSVNTVTVNSVDILGGAVSYSTDLTTTAAAVAAQINRNPKNHQFIASSAGAVITITAANGMGTLPNTWAVAATLTTLTASYTAMAGGVNAVNGLNYDAAVAGVISKVSTETWSGNAVASGTAGWFRIRGAGDSGSGASTTAVRVDGAISTSGAQMNLASLTISQSAPFILSSGSLTIPQQ